MTDEKITISWDDLQTRRVESRLREQEAMARNRSYAEMREEALPVAAPGAARLRHNALFVMSVLGLIGGVLAFGALKVTAGPLAPAVGALLHYQPDAHGESDRRLDEIKQIAARVESRRLDAGVARSMVDDIEADGRDNAYFRIARDPTLDEAQRRALTGELLANDRAARFVINVISYGLAGIMIAMCLAIAEPITQHKRRAVAMSALAGSAAGLVGGVAAALLTRRIAPLAGSFTAGQAGWVQDLVTPCAAWGMLGLFLGLGSGLVPFNPRRIGVGIAGGLVGGLIGGAVFHPLETVLGAGCARLAALVAIGGVAGWATGLLENVVKSGWLKVTSGIIAGKQFILYRNPTYIGSSPDCQIYLFKDPQVGRRHCAIHLLRGRIEIEDLPLGAPTMINGRAVSRAALQSGDTIQIGATSFQFQQKRPSVAR